MRLETYFAGAFSCVAAASSTIRPTAVVAAGTIVGVRTSLPSSTVAVNKFVGIPYAEPPVGSKRFMPPAPVATFGTEPFNATQSVHSCYQQGGSNPEHDVANENEDCLILNVYAPAGCSKAGRPVLFWIHGGNLQNGFAGPPDFDGTSFATNHDIVVVTTNYRLNAFGFPGSPELAVAENNLGFLDQRLALQWAQTNIHAFGGDPEKVTIAGESSGASSVDRLVNTFVPPLKAPFRAAGESSGQATLSAFPRNSGAASWAALVDALNCTDKSTTAELSCVQVADAKAIRAIVNDNNLDFSPMNDGVTQIDLPYLSNRTAGDAARVPLLIGSDAQEGNLLAFIYQVNISTFAEADLQDFLVTSTGGNEALIEQFTDLVHLIMQTDGLSLFYAAAQAYTELVYQCPARLLSHASAQSGMPTWRYYYNDSFPNIFMEGYPDLGSYHTSDLSLIWGIYPTEGATEREVELSKSIQAAWAGFVKDPWGTGPGWEKVNGTNTNLACWGCDSGTQATIIDDEVVDARCPYYEGIYPTVTTPYF